MEAFYIVSFTLFFVIGILFMEAEVKFFRIFGFAMLLIGSACVIANLNENFPNLYAEGWKMISAQTFTAPQTGTDKVVVLMVAHALFAAFMLFGTFIAFGPNTRRG